MDKNNKYYFINIKIPIEIKTNKENKLLQDRIDVFFSECDELPDIKENHENLISNKIKEIINNIDIYTINTSTIDEMVIEETPIEVSVIEESPTYEKGIEEKIEQSSIFIKKDEIKPHKKRDNNISFKHNNSKKKSNGFTKKN